MSFVHGYEASAYVSRTPLYYSKGGYHSSHQVHGHYISSVVQAPIEHHSHVVVPVEYAPYVPMGQYTSRYHHKGGYQSSHHTVIDSSLYGSTHLSRKHLKRALKYGFYGAPHVESFVNDVDHLDHYGAHMTFRSSDVNHYGTAHARVTGKYVSHKGYVYTSAQGHDVDSLVQIGDGDRFVYIDHLLVGGFSIAPGDANDIEVANAHTWGSYGMVFSDGQVAGTSLNIAECGPSGIGKKTDNHELISFSDCGGKVAAVHGNHDVLLRKRA